MSDSPQGPGWWLASDGTWHPPELHPSLHDDTNPVEPIAVPEAPVVASPEPAILGPSDPTPAVPSAQQQGPVPTASRSRWSPESDVRPESGPRYPDLFQQAVSGSLLADTVTVKGPDGERGPTPSGSAAPVGGTPPLVSASSSASAVSPGEVGAFTGATARKRRRRGH